MHDRICPARLAAADRIERDRRAGRDQRLGQLVEEGRRGGVADVARAELAQQLFLLGLAHDVDEADAVGDADPVQHLAEVRGRRRVDERLVAFHAHRLDHAEGGQRVDEARRAVGGLRAGRQRQALVDLHAAQLRVHRAADRGDRAAEQRLRGGDAPASTTMPAPSLPTGIDWSRRPAIARISLSGTFAVRTGRSALPDAVAVLMSAAPNSRPMSDGLIGAPRRGSRPRRAPAPAPACRRARARARRCA
jgi:hypothetical protein